MFRRLALLVVAGPVLLLGGCSSSPKTAIVRGKVTYNGKALPNGTIMFTPTSGPTATGEIQQDGSYTLTTFRKGDGAVPGKYTVVVVALKDTGDRLPEERAALPPPIIPERYSSAATSDLRAEVKEGENTIDFTLDGEKPKR